MPVSRFGVSLETDLLTALDEYVLSNKFPNRSQGIRHLIEKNLVESKWKCNHIVAGGIVLTYELDKQNIQPKLVEIQKMYFDVILSVQHFYISSDKILEIIAVKGTANKLTELSEKLISVKGVEHGKLMMSKVE